MDTKNDIIDDDIDMDELQLIYTLSQMECADDGIYPVMNFMVDEEI